MSETQEQSKLLDLIKAGLPGDKMDVDTSTVRYAIYARKSTTDDDKQVRSIKDQVDEIMEKLVVPNDLNVVKTYTESFSAKESDVREQFMAMMREIKAGRIDGVLAWHPDRLSRNMKDAGEIIDLIDKDRIRDLQFATFTFENNPAGKMLLGITFVVSKQYSEHLSESVLRGNKKAVEDGEFIGKFKHGYVVDTNRHFQKDEDSFVKVQRMFKMALDKKSQKEIREWINSKDYTVQKKPGADATPHIWSKDDVSELLRDPHYAGIHKWGKTVIDLREIYDFMPMVTEDEFFKINKIDSFNSNKILTLHRPKGGDIRADFLRGIVYCGHCGETLTSMIIDKKAPDKNNPDEKKIISSRYYYKCETESCEMLGRSARAKYITDYVQKFFKSYLFITKGNYDTYVQNAKEAIKRKNRSLDSSIASARAIITNKNSAFEQTKDLIIANPELKEFYDLAGKTKEIEKLEKEMRKLVRQRERTKDAIITYEEYLKLFESTPVIMGKMHDMKAMDKLVRTFFSNFTITATGKDFRQGSHIVGNLKEPWSGFLKDDNFVRGAG